MRTVREWLTEALEQVCGTHCSAAGDRGTADMYSAACRTHVRSTSGLAVTPRCFPAHTRAPPPPPQNPQTPQTPAPPNPHGTAAAAAELTAPTAMAHALEPPPGYRVPPFPSLGRPVLADATPQRLHTLYHVADAWRFTLLWTLITYAVFHVAAVLLAVLTHGWKRSSWSYLWAVPGVYLVAAGLEALLAGSVVGLVCVLAPPPASPCGPCADVCPLPPASAPSTGPATTR